MRGVTLQFIGTLFRNVVLYLFIFSGLIDDNVYIATDRIVEHTRKIKRQTKPDASSASDDAASGSIFTDEDFEVVSKLHFVNSKKAVIVEKGD